jgi:hypothetical protein
MKSIKVWKEGYNYGSQIRNEDDETVIGWEDLTVEEQTDLILAMYAMADFFSQHVKK